MRSKGRFSQCKVLHMKGQIETGIAVVEKLMERRLLMAVSDKSADFASLQRRALADARTKFDGATVEHMHHVGCLDFSKFGRLSVPEITECAQWTKKVLSYNPNFSTLVERSFSLKF